MSAGERKRMKYKSSDILSKLESMANPEAVAGMARYGINPNNTLGVSIPKLRGIAKEIGKDRDLAEQLWSSGIHEARLLAGFIDDPRLVTDEQMERWVKDFDSWDVCDQCCSNLFDRTDFARRKALEWSGREEEFVKRAGFVLMASLAVHDKKAPDGEFERFLPIIRREASDDRNFVKKAVNWALRQIGKRSRGLNATAVTMALDMLQSESKSAKWVARDALRELTDEKTLARLDAKAERSAASS